MSTSTYSRTYRAAEIVAIAAYLAILLLICHQLLTGHWLNEPAYWAWGVSAILLGLVCADFVSGFVHWLADSFGSVHLPILGPAFIEPFREHHTDPDAITHHDFVEVNGNNCMVILMFLPFVAALKWFTPSTVDAWLNTWTAAFTFAIFMTNQMHSWAHEDDVPTVVAWMQRSRLILSVEDHAIHHTAPHDTYFCITFGWLNPILHRTKFFSRLYRVVVTVLPFARRTDADLEGAYAAETFPPNTTAPASQGQ